jgi:signal transduction histidine kinase
VSVGSDESSGTGYGELFRDGGENGRLMAAFDWSTTPVGPVAEWPASLRHTVRTVLASRFPMILTWGPEYTQIYNDGYATLIGAKHPEAIGRDLRVTQAEGWGVLQQPVEHAMATREPTWIPQLLLQLERAGYREETYFTVSHAPAFGDDGEVAGMHAVCTEVTRQVLAERRQRLLHDVATAAGSLGDEEVTVRAMTGALAGNPLDVPFAAVYLTGPDDGGLRRAGTVGFAHELLAEVAGDVDALLPVDVTHLGVTGGPWGDAVTEAVVLPLTGGGDRVGALVIGVNPNRAIDDEYRSFHELLAGQFAAAVINARAYAAERSRAEALAELDQAKTAFFANVSHELRTPLTLLLGPIRDTLADDAADLPVGVREQLTLALRNGQRLQRLVNDLLEFVSIEAGRASPVRVATDVAAFTAELAGVLRAAAERAGLRLTVDCPPLGRTAHVDQRMWEKIVLNLVANAVKYTFVGSIEVSLRAEGGRLVLRVADTGVGIPAAELPHLFERFHRVAGSAARSREGTGLGLALVRELVALHGGEVTVVSEPGVGSTFTATVPFGAPDALADSPAAPSDTARGPVVAPWDDDLAPADARAATPGTCVLVVDDNADMRAYLTRLLSPPLHRADGDRRAGGAAEHPDAAPRRRPDRRDDARPGRFRPAPGAARGSGDPGRPGGHAHRAGRPGSRGRGLRGGCRRLPRQAVRVRRADRQAAGRARPHRGPAGDGESPASLPRCAACPGCRRSGDDAAPAPADEGPPGGAGMPALDLLPGAWHGERALATRLDDVLGPGAAPAPPGAVRRGRARRGPRLRPGAGRL